MPEQNGNYNPSFDTPLGQVDEVLYRLYKQMYASADKSGTYDYRGAYAAGVAPNTGSNPAQFGHFTDQFKKPNYPTFSVESQYAGAYPEKAGRWQGDTFIPPASYQKGTTSVKKKYQRGTDSVDAKLTPREAVLNRNAAELLGRDAISRLNAHGNMLSKRGVDLASLPSDPTPGPSTENMLGYQMGTSMVRGDDRSDLLAEVDNTFYGGGQVPAPTPTPTPMPQRIPVTTIPSGTPEARSFARGVIDSTEGIRNEAYGPQATLNLRRQIDDEESGARRYQYGTSSVDDYASPFLKNKNGASRINRPGITNVQDDPTKSGYNPVSKSQYMGRSGTLLGLQFNQTTGRVNPPPIGAVGLQGFSQPSSPSFTPVMTHTEMAADIARRNLTATGSQLGSPQQSNFPFASRYQDIKGSTFSATSPEGEQWSVNLPVNATDVMGASQQTGAGGGYGMKKFTTTQAYNSPQNQQMLGQQQQNRISRIQSDTLKDQGVDLNQNMQNVNLNALADIQANKDRQNGYGSAYGY